MFMKQKTQINTKMLRYTQIKTFVIVAVSVVILFSIATLATKQTSSSLASNGAYIKSDPAQQLNLTIDPFSEKCPKGTHLECICVKDKEEPDFDNVPTSDETMVVDPPYAPDPPGLPYPGDRILPPGEIPPWSDIPFPDISDSGDLFDWLPVPAPSSGGMPIPYAPDSPGLPYPGEMPPSWGDMIPPDSDDLPDDSIIDPTPETLPDDLKSTSKYQGWFDWLKKLFGINTNPGLPVNRIDEDARPYSWLEKLFGMKTNPGSPVDKIDENAEPYAWVEEMKKEMREHVIDNDGFTSPEHKALVEAMGRETDAFLNYARDLSPENLKKWEDAQKELYDLFGWPLPKSFLIDMPAPESPASPEPEPDPDNQEQEDDEILPNPDNPENDGTFIVDDGQHWGCKLSISWQRPSTCELLDGEKPDTCSDDSDCTFVLTFKDTLSRGIVGFKNYLNKLLNKLFGGLQSDSSSESDTDPDFDPEPEPEPEF